MDGSNLLLPLLKDQPGLKVSSGHSQEEGVSYPTYPLPPRQGLALNQGDLSAAHKVVLTMAYSKARAGWLEKTERGKSLINIRSQIAGFISHFKIKAKPVTCTRKASFLI